MLTNAEIERVARLVRLAPYMDQEMRGKLLDLVRDRKAAEGAGWMPNSAIQPMVDAVGDAQVRDIVNDLKGGRAEPGGLPPAGAKGPEGRRSGPVNPLPLGSPSGIRWIDQMCDAQDQIDRAERRKALA